MYSIGDLSKQTGVKIPTIRYYEQMDLIDKPLRTNGNQRRYKATDLERLSFIRHARDLGFTIEAIRDLVLLNNLPHQSCVEAHDIVTEHLAAIKSRLQKLRRLEKELKRIAATSDDGKIGRCHVIHALADHSLCVTDH